MKTWKPFEDDCLHCGSSAEVFTDSKEAGMAYDGDEARCTECKCPGYVNVYEEPCANISWHDEPDCDCEWCKANQERPIEDEKRLPNKTFSYEKGKKDL